MKLRLTPLVLAVAAIASGCASPVAAPGPIAAKWYCAGKGLMNATYTGGTTASVQLAGSSKGEESPVAKNVAGTIANGKTSTGIPFSCVRTAG